MSIINSPLLLTGADTAYQITRSLRFNSPDSAYLSRTPSVAGNRKTWTWAAWVKRTVKNTSTDQMLFAGGATSSDTGFLALDFNSSDKLRLSSAATNFLITTAVYRDAAAWMHIVLAFDATQGTNANKVKLYVNGTEVTAFDTDGRSSITNQDYGINQAAVHEIGRATLGSNKYFDGYIADPFLIDGQALDPSSFTTSDLTTGQLIPKAYTGTYGTNGFHLPFSDNSATTATTLGKDTSPNGNNWTPNNFSVTAGAGNDSLVDTPSSAGTDSGLGGQVTGNYATLNPLDKNANITPANGNLDIVGTGPAHRAIRATFAVSSGKWYWEATLNSYSSGLFGIAKGDASLADGQFIGANATSWGYIGNGNKYNNGSAASYGASFTTGDVIGVALDADNGTLVFYKNGSSQGTAYTGLTSGPYFPAVSTYSSSDSYSFNFGQRAFAYPVSGFKALCDTNLPSPLIAKPSTVMDVKLYTGNGSTQTVSGLGFNPDLVWIKSRSNAYDHGLFDAVRGATNRLVSNATQAEDSQSGVTAFNSDGFSLGSYAGQNGSSTTYAAWCWDAGTSTVTNTQGSITSSVRVNTSAGFSIVTYTGTGANATVGHGLNVAPQLLIVKNRGAVASWAVWHTAFSGSQFLGLNTTNATQTSSAYWNSTTPTSSVFSVGSDSSSNGSTNGMVAYCFAPVTGYSSMGSYVSTGTSDNAFNFCGFKPRFLLLKNATVGNSWVILDSARSTFNAADDWLGPNSSSAEDSNNAAYSVDFLSNGFKIRSGNGIVGNSGDTVVWAAFAESPFAYARAR